jgi:hypothetical protein
MNNNSQYNCIVQNEYSILLLLINVIVIAINDYKSEGIKGGGGGSDRDKVIFSVLTLRMCNFDL